uniref:Uncharacterized protein n=1 Tax=Octopus bimaculoides TaxID=37653 RepID=A0A0L8HGH8_OCTBM
MPGNESCLPSVLVKRRWTRSFRVSAKPVTGNKPSTLENFAITGFKFRIGK